MLNIHQVFAKLGKEMAIISDNSIYTVYRMDVHVR